MTCRDQKFGHNFPHVGGRCTECGISQIELSGGYTGPPKPTLQNPFALARPATPPRNVHLHSELHAFVDEVRQRFGETAKSGRGSFGYYLGFFKKVGLEHARAYFADVRQANDPKRLFWWHIGQHIKRNKK